MLIIFAASETDEIAARVFLAIAVVVVVARIMGGLAKRIGQPAVVGEIVAGILLGPSFLGAFGGDLDERLFPLEIRDYLQVVAQLGLIIFMFIVGLELDLKLIRGKERVAGVVSVSSVALPFSLGIVLAVALFGAHDQVGSEAIEFWPFALFLGASMSVTAFPVLARILTERGMHRTETGVLALACAAIDDILAWSLLAVVVAIVEAGSILDLPRILLLSLAFVAVMFVVVKPMLASITERFRRAGRLTPVILSTVLTGMLVSSYLTWLIGIHAIFGAFLFGVIMPREDSVELHHEILERLESVSVLLLLPVFFVVTGLSVNVRAIDATGFAELLLILLTACAGKFIGATVAARFQGIGTRKASAVGVLMNTRGLTELVILNIGLAAGVLTEDLFTLLVLMALITTFMTAPLLRVVYPDALLRRDIEEAEKAALGAHVSHRILIPLLGDVEDVASRATLKVAIDIASGGGSELVLARYVDNRRQLEVGSGLGVELVSMAEALDMLQDVVDDAGRRGVRAVVRSQFTSDARLDVEAQLGTIEADLVLLPQRRPTQGESDDDLILEDLVGKALVDVAVVRASSTVASGVVGVELDGSRSDGVTTEIAARLARGQGTRLALDSVSGTRHPTKLLGEVDRALRARGFVSSAGDGLGGAATVVRSAPGIDRGDEGGRTTITVHARPEIAAPTIAERVSRLENAPPVADEVDGRG